MSDAVSVGIDRIHGIVDRLMTEGRFGVLNGLLTAVRRRAGYRHTDDLLAYLVATLPAESKLPARVLLFESVRAVLVSRGERKCLEGLE